MGDVGEHKLGEVGDVHVVGEVLAEAGKGEAGEQVLGRVSTEGKCPLSQGDHHRQGVHCKQGVHGCQHSLYRGETAARDTAVEGYWCRGILLCGIML